MEKINPPIRVKVCPSGLPFDAWQYFEVGKPTTINQLKKGDFFLDVPTGMEEIYMVCSDPESIAEDEDEQPRLSAYSSRVAQCDYEFDPGDYERLEAYLIPAGIAHKLIFPLIAVDLNS
jgi:hypothetical protein